MQGSCRSVQNLADYYRNWKKLAKPHRILQKVPEPHWILKNITSSGKVLLNLSKLLQNFEDCFIYAQPCLKSFFCKRKNHQLKIIHSLPITYCSLIQIIQHSRFLSLVFCWFLSNFYQTVGNLKIFNIYQLKTWHLVNLLGYRNI